MNVTGDKVLVHILFCYTLSNFLWAFVRDRLNNGVEVQLREAYGVGNTSLPFCCTRQTTIQSQRVFRHLNMAFLHCHIRSRTVVGTSSYYKQ
jgi:hypothetical protein